MIDGKLSSGSKNGYNFTTGDAPAASPTGFVMAAAPMVISGANATGRANFVSLKLEY